ncbi:MAG: hypothetical protein QM642_01540 [Edaphocola sp.]
MSHAAPVEKSNIPSNAALWFGLLIVALVVCAINFIHAESAPSHGGEHGAALHGAAEGHHAEAGSVEPHEATEAAINNAHDTAKAPAHEEAHH